MSGRRARSLLHNGLMRMPSHTLAAAMKRGLRSDLSWHGCAGDRERPTMVVLACELARLASALRPGTSSPRAHLCFRYHRGLHGPRGRLRPVRRGPSCRCCSHWRRRSRCRRPTPGCAATVPRAETAWRARWSRRRAGPRARRPARAPTAPAAPPGTAATRSPSSPAAQVTKLPCLLRLFGNVWHSTPRVGLERTLARTALGPHWVAALRACEHAQRAPSSLLANCVHSCAPACGVSTRFRKRDDPPGTSAATQHDEPKCSTDGGSRTRWSPELLA